MQLAEFPTQMDLSAVMCPEGPSLFSVTSASALAGSECHVVGWEDTTLGASWKNDSLSGPQLLISKTGTIPVSIKDCWIT